MGLLVKARGRGGVVVCRLQARWGEERRGWPKMKGK
jgi:hypothetical protein